jgi:predicted tellurium resistance membrane protein TerC
LFKSEAEGEVENKGASFWKTVLMVELMDIAFSIDSVVAAFGVSDKVWVLFVGGILGVLMMRGVAQVFLRLIDKFPELEQTAFILIAIIAGKMLAGAFGFHMSQVVFFAILIAVFVGTMIISSVKRKRKADEEA